MRDNCQETLQLFWRFSATHVVGCAPITGYVNHSAVTIGESINTSQAFCMSENNSTVDHAVQFPALEKLKNFSFPRLHRIVGGVAATFLMALLCLAAGCVAPDATPVSVNDTAPDAVITLR